MTQFVSAKRLMQQHHSVIDKSEAVFTFSNLHWECLHSVFGQCIESGAGLGLGYSSKPSKLSVLRAGGRSGRVVEKGSE